MKLYATVTSERASKGQGGNRFIEVNLTRNMETVMLVKLDVHDMSLRVFHTMPLDAVKVKTIQTKGEKQKTDNGMCPVCREDISNTIYHEHDGKYYS